MLRHHKHFLNLLNLYHHTISIQYYWQNGTEHLNTRYGAERMQVSWPFDVCLLNNTKQCYDITSLIVLITMVNHTHKVYRHTLWCHSIVRSCFRNKHQNLMIFPHPIWYILTCLYNCTVTLLLLNTIYVFRLTLHHHLHCLQT